MTTSDGGGAGNTEASAGSDTGSSTAEDAETSGDTGETSAGLPIDPPPTVENLTPAGDPLIFPVTSAPHNNPGSVITVRVRDEAGQTAETSIYQPSTVKDPGTEIWTELEPNDGEFSAASAVALHGDIVFSAGTLWTNPQALGILRRHDQAGDWSDTDEGWSKSHTEWTKIAWVKSGYLGPTGLAVDGEGNIVLVGTAYEDGQPCRYVARFHADGALDWETAGTVRTEARAVGVQPDGTIYVAGARRTSVNPDRWDMERTSGTTGANEAARSRC